MIDDGQVERDGFGGDRPEVMKSARTRGSAKAKVGERAFNEPAEPLALFDVSAQSEEPQPVEVAVPVEPVEEADTGEVESTPVQANEPETEHITSDQHAAADPSSSEPVEAVSEQETVPVEEPASLVASAPTRLFFLTNRMNLIGLLGSRLLAPRESFRKYYADLLELSPGWVPLLVGPPPVQLIERVVAERGASAPVLVELSEAALNGKRLDGRVVYSRAVALADVKAIHFPDEKSLREHRSRRYGNVFPHECLLRVNPELFSTESDAEVVIAAPMEAPETDWSRIDRVRGAISAAMAAADNGEALAVAAGLLGATSLPKDTIVPPWLSWSGLTGEVAEPTSETDEERADRLIFRAAYRVLGERDRSESWSPSEVLKAAVAEIAAANPSGEVNAIIERHLQRVRELVNVERDFERFRNPGSQYVAAKSFVTVLLRPDLGQLLEWPVEETGIDETTRVVAAVLAGRLRGVARESVTFRDAALDDYTAAWAIQTAAGQTSTLGVVEFIADDDATAVIVGGVRLKTSLPLRSR
ncbi:hypothetical protein [Nocardia sp. NPDC059195]|uniref:hypothetical protein n=1 Tax=Nocardia sp. NPDC059195 TaxID=3346765 RepID=UPI00369DD8D5